MSRPAEASATILASGPWSRPHVISRRVESSFNISDEAAQEIDLHWEALNRLRGRPLHDGPLCRLERFHVNDGRLTLEWSPTTYKTFVGTNMRVEREMPQRSDAIGVSAALLLPSGEVVLGRRASSVAFHANRLHTIAGMLEPRDSGDPFAGILRELREEVGLEGSQVESIHLAALVAEPELRQPEMIFVVQSAMGLGDLQARLDRSEHGELIAVPMERWQATEVIEEATPVARAALRLLIERRVDQAL